MTQDERCNTYRLGFMIHDLILVKDSRLRENDNLGFRVILIQG